MTRLRIPSLAVRSLGLVIPLARADPSAPAPRDPAAIELFETEVRPVLANRCQTCHGASKSKGDLRLDSRVSILKGGHTGPAVAPGKPEESLVIGAINYGDLYQMLPKSKLPAREIAALTRWVAIEAPWPESGHAGPTPKPATAPAGLNLRERARHWSFQPVRIPRLPDVKRAD